MIEAAKRLSKNIDCLNRQIGRMATWFALFMVLVQFFVVVARYIFSLSHPAVQESIWYSHGLLFMIGAGFTLLYNGHVRVDVFYRTARPTIKAWVDLIGSFCLTLPIAIACFYLSFSYVLNSWKVLESSTELSGLPFMFLFKSVIWIFAILIGLQAISQGLKAWLFLKGQRDTYVS